LKKIFSDYENVERGEIKISDSEERVGSLVNWVSKKIVTGSTVTEVFKEADARGKANAYDYKRRKEGRISDKHWNKRELIDLAHLTKVSKEKLKQTHKMLPVARAYKEESLKKSIAAYERKLEPLREKEERFCMEIEDNLSEITKQNTVKHEHFEEKLFRRWYHKEWKVKTKKLSLDEMAKKSFVNVLEKSAPKYMNYVRYQHTLEKYVNEGNEASSNGSSKKTKSRTRALSVKRETYPKLNWNQLDEHLANQENWDSIKYDVAESALNKAAVTESMLKNKGDHGIWKALPNSMYLTPTFFRRIGVDFVKSHFTTWSFQKWRKHHFHKLQSLNMR